MIFEFDSNRRLFVARSIGQKKRSAVAFNRPKLAFAVSPKYLSNETKIYISIARIPRVVYVIFLGFFQSFIFPTSGRYLQTAALKQQNLIWTQGWKLYLNSTEKKVKKKEYEVNLK